MRLLRNNKGGMQDVFVGLIIMFIGVLGYIVSHAILEGTTATSGMFYIATSQLGINNTSLVYTTTKNGWSMVSVGIVVAGILYMIIAQLREEYREYPLAYR